MAAQGRALSFPEPEIRGLLGDQEPRKGLETTWEGLKKIKADKRTTVAQPDCGLNLG